MSVLKNTKPLSKSLMGRVAALSLAIGGGLLLSLPSQAGVFNLPRFVPVNEFAIGIEPNSEFKNTLEVFVVFKKSPKRNRRKGLIAT